MLMLQDDNLGHCSFYVCANTTADFLSKFIFDWCAAFRIPDMFILGGSTYIQDETLRLAGRGLRVPHDFTPPCSPWNSETVERLRKELLEMLRTLVGALKESD